MSVERFIGLIKHRPKKFIFDFDATDDRVHSKQEEHFFHGD